MRSQVARKKLSVTDARNLRTLLLLNVFEPEEIGDRIKRARERAGLRQEDLADLIGMSTRQVQNYEAGESKQYGKLRAIAGATGVSVDWLLHGETENGNGVDVSELLALVRPGPETEELGPLTADEIRGRFEGLAVIIRDQIAGVREEIQRLEPPQRPDEDQDLLLVELAGLRAEVERLVRALERRQASPHEASGP